MERTPATAISNSAAEGNWDEDSHDNRIDKDGSNFHLEANNPSVETPPPSDAVGGCLARPRGEAIDSITISGQLTLYLNGAAPRYALMLTQLVDLPADTAPLEDYLLDGKEGASGRRRCSIP